MSKRATGEGSVYQRSDGKWVAAASVGWVDGVLKRRKVVANTQAEAIARFKELRSRLEGGATVAKDRLTVAAWLREWVEKEAAPPATRPRTWQSYRMICERHLTPTLGHIKLRELTSRTIRDYLAEKRQSGLSARTVQYHHAVLRRALRVAEQRGLVPNNQARLVTPGKVQREEIEPLTPEQCRTFLSSVHGHRLEALFLVAALTGLRQSELLGLSWADVDFEGRTLRVDRSLQRYDHEWHRDEVKTQKSRRTLSIPEPAFEPLKAWKVRQIEERLAAGPAYVGNPWELVFTREDGSPTHGSHANRQFQAALSAAGLPAGHFHLLRHGLATMALATGTDLQVISRLLGHSTIAITSATYTHVGEQLHRQALDRVSAAVFGTGT